MGSGVKSVLGLEDVRDVGALWRSVLAELVGTFLLLVVGTGSAANISTPPSVVHIGIAFGFIIAALVQSIGHISGCHINPAVTVGMLLVGRISAVKGALYILAQCAGAIGGAAIIYGITGGSAPVGAVGLGESVSEGSGLLVEAIITFVLLLVVSSVTDEHRIDLGTNAAPVAVGLAALAVHVFAIPYTGCGLNPARALGPAAIYGSWDHHWIYWVGPLIGGSLGTVVYRLAFRAPKDTDSSYNL